MANTRTVCWSASWPKVASLSTAVLVGPLPKGCRFCTTAWMARLLPPG
jgi:hypothetical protein